MILTITGASGVGKTSITKALAQQLSDQENIRFFYFDDIGMPDWSKVEDTKKWQRETTIEWIDRLVKVARNENVHIVFEGSTEAKFFVQGFEKNNFSDYKVLLFDCDPQTMKGRLHERGQPELYTNDMVNWLNYLRNEAISSNVEIIKTDNLSKQEVGQRILEKLS